MNHTQTRINELNRLVKTLNEFKKSAGFENYGLRRAITLIGLRKRELRMELAALRAAEGRKE